MPAGILRPCLAGARYCASCLVTLAAWSAWLLLLILLVFQCYIATVNEMPVPRFLLHAIEGHLAESGVSVIFGRATFDPSGRVLLQKARFKLASFSEPVVTADAIYIRLDPLALLGMRFDAREIRATGANLFVPAMLSASGRAEKIIQDLDAGFSITPRDNEFSVDYLNCRLGGVFVSAHGTINAGTVARNTGPATSLPLAEFLSRNYVILSREFSSVEEKMAGLDHAVVTAVLAPSETRGAIVSAELFANGFRIEAPQAIDAGEIHAASRFPLLAGAPLMTSAFATARSLRVGGEAAAAAIRVWIRGILRMDPLAFDPREVQVTAASALFQGTSIGAPLAKIVPKGGKAFTAEVGVAVFGKPLSLQGDLDLAAKSADISFDGFFASGLTEPLSDRLGVNVRRFADLSEPLAATGRLRLSAGFKFQDVQARVSSHRFAAYGVRFDEAHGNVSYDGTHFAARQATVVSGDNLALGTYEQNFSTQEYRYLLSGRLRPLDISPWFGGEWWTNIFGNFAFPMQPPDATVDVRGHYLRGAAFSVFGFADSAGPVIRKVPFDRARVLIYVDPANCDGLDVTLMRDKGKAHGSFRLSTDQEKGSWRALDIEATSRLDPAPLGQLLPPEGAEAIASFSFDRHPSVSFQSHFDGPAAGSSHRTIHADVRSDMGLRIHGVAFDMAAFKLDISDDDIDIRDVNAGFAGGAVVATARVTGAAPDRRLRFKVSLAGGSLGQAATAAKGYMATGSAGNTTALDTFAKDKSGVRLDLNATAEGRLGDPTTFGGEGNVQVQGANLGELSLLGGLSKALKFPELRFTQAKSTFKIENGFLNFPDLSVLGANSEIRAKGTYSIDRRLLDFSATIYPFMESKSLLQIFNALSAPISAVLRVRLSGSIDKPSWRLAYSPLNLLREGDSKQTGVDRSGPATPLSNPPP